MEYWVYGKLSSRNTVVLHGIWKYWRTAILCFCNTGILQTGILQYWDTANLDTANWDLLNNTHIIAVYTIHWGYILCMFFHIHINYFTQLFHMYLLILHMHTFTDVFTYIVLLLHVNLIYFYSYSTYNINSMFTCFT